MISSKDYRELVLKNRSYRRFAERDVINRGILEELIDLARCSPSSANRQPLKFILCHTPQMNSLIFPHLAWAGYLKDWPGPAAGERPSAYIIIVLDKSICDHAGVDPGIVAQTMLLGAVTRGYGGCMIGAFQKQGLTDTLGLDSRYEIQLVVALGRPAEKVVLENAGDSIRYYRDDESVHHVPKRGLAELVLD